MGVSHFKREARSKKVKPLGVIRSTLETNHLQAVQPLFSARKACPRCEFAANSTKKTLFSLPQLNLCCDCDGLHTWRYSEQSMSLRGENNPVTLVHAARPKPTYTELAPSPPPGSWAVPSLKPSPTSTHLNAAPVLLFPRAITPTHYNLKVFFGKLKTQIRPRSGKPK